MRLAASVAVVATCCGPVSSVAPDKPAVPARSASPSAPAMVSKSYERGPGAYPGRLVWQEGGSGKTVWAIRDGFTIWDLNADKLHVFAPLATPACITCDGEKGKHCVTVDRVGTAVLWSAESGKRLALLSKLQPADIDDPNSEGLVVGTCWEAGWAGDGSALVLEPAHVVWTSSGGLRRVTIPGDWRGALSPSQKYVGVEDGTTRFRIWGLQEERELLTIPLFGAEKEEAAYWMWAPHGDTLAIRQTDGIGIWDVNNRTKLLHIPGYARMEWSRDERYLWLAGSSVAVVDAKTGATLTRMRGHGPVTMAAWHPVLPIVANYGSELTVWSPQEKRVLFRQYQSSLMAKMPKWSPDGQWLAIGTRAWSVKGWRESAWKDPNRKSRYAQWAPNSRWLYVNDGRDAWIMDVNTGREVHRLRRGGYLVRWTQDGGVFGDGDRLSHVLVTRFTTGNDLWLSLQVVDGSVEKVSYSSSGEYTGRRAAVEAAVREFPASLSPGAKLRPAAARP